MPNQEFAEGFVQRAEKMFNSRDLTSIMADYTDDAVMELYAEGLHERNETHAQIESSFKFIFALFPSFQLKKTLVSAGDDGRIVCEWEGSVDGQRRSHGIDLWWLRSDNSVYQHKMFSFGHVVSPDSLVGRVRWASVHPSTTLRSLRLDRARKRDGISHAQF